MTLTGLPHTKGTKEGVFVETKQRCLVAIRSGKVATWANENGTVNAWKDDKGIYRANAQSFRRDVANAECMLADDAATWFMTWIKKFREM